MLDTRSRPLHEKQIPGSIEILTSYELSACGLGHMVGTWQIFLERIKSLPFANYQIRKAFLIGAG